jgi:HK97 family phage major capsid protein
VKTSRILLAAAALTALVAPLVAVAASLHVDLIAAARSLLDWHTAGTAAISGLMLAELAVVDVKTIGEQIAQFKVKLQALQDKALAIVSKGISEGRTLDEHESEDHKQTAAEIKAIEDHLVLLKQQETIMVSRATPVVVDSGRGQGAVQIAGTGPIAVRRNTLPGTGFTRYVALLAVSKGNLMQAEVLANNLYKDMPELGQVMKAAVAAGTTSDTTWAGPLVQYNDMVSEFIELLRPQTILGRMSGVRRVPFNIRIPRQTAGSSGSFVGEGAPAPVQKMDFDNLTLPWAKASSIVVITAELAKLSNPSAEALVRQDLMDGISQFLDKRLIDPAYAGVANISPASLTNGVTPTQASGATLAAIDANVRALMTTFANAELGLQSAVWVMSASLAIRLSMIRTNQDFKAFPELTMSGGSFYGIPVIVSNNVTPSGSPGDQHLILIDQSNVLLADDGQMMVDVSTEASLEMNDAPSGGATSLRSLWQNGLMGVKVDRWIYWMKRRSAAVQFIDKAQSYAS